MMNPDVKSPARGGCVIIMYLSLRANEGSAAII